MAEIDAMLTMLPRLPVAVPLQSWSSADIIKSALHVLRHRLLLDHSPHCFPLYHVKSSEIDGHDNVEVLHLGLVQKCSRSLIEARRLHDEVYPSQLVESSIDESTYSFFICDIAGIREYRCMIGQRP